MKLLKHLLLYTVLITYFSCSTKDVTLANQASLTEAINTFNNAFAKGDIETLTSMIADEYKHTNGTSKAIVAKDWLNYLRKRNKDLQSKDLIVHSYDMDQIEMVLYGAAAIVTGRIQTSSTSKGVLKENKYRVTHVWVYENHRWKRAGFHDGKIN